MGVLRSTYSLAKQADINLGFAYADLPLPESDIYIMPSIDTTRAITRHRLVELLERVKNGATLYLSVGSAQFRWFDRLSGLDIAYREGINDYETIFIDGERLTLKPDFKYVAEKCSAEVIASSEDGRPVFVKSKYGKGYIFASTIPVEKCLINQNDVFNREESQKFSKWYTSLKSENSNKRVLKISAQMLCVTEHISDKNSRYAVIVNYSKETINSNIEIARDWKIDEVYTGDISGDMLTLKACDAAVIKLLREV